MEKLTDAYVSQLRKFCNLYQLEQSQKKNPSAFMAGHIGLVPTATVTCQGAAITSTFIELRSANYVGTPRYTYILVALFLSYAILYTTYLRLLSRVIAIERNIPTKSIRFQVLMHKMVKQEKLRFKSFVICAL